mmetsp:Transcript_23756/g.42621  ORF Transcript_23756/g.42621 Transcript_23756/m.42621 type:complete len:271 (+) Transcript_23756:3968-4780(+)
MFGAFGHRKLSDVFGQIFQLCRCIPSRGDQPPAHQGDKCQTRNSRNPTHWRKIEHLERFAQTVLPDRGDDDVGRRPDKGDHAAQDRGKAERHEAEPGAATGLARGLHIDGHQQRQRRHVVHEGGQDSADGPHQGDMSAEAAAGVHQCARDQENRPRPDQPRRDHKHQRDHQGGRVTKAGKRIFGGDDAQYNTCHQRRKGDDIVAKFAPEQKAEHKAKEGKEDDLICRHPHTLGACLELCQRDLGLCPRPLASPGILPEQRNGTCPAIWGP